MPATRTASTETRVFPAAGEALIDVRAFLHARCLDAGISGPLASDLALAVCEASANAIRHSGSRLFRVTWRLGTDRVEIQVRDQGCFARRVLQLESGGPIGHGLALMMSIMDELSLRRGTPRRPGTEVRLVKRLERAEAGRGPGRAAGATGASPR